MTKLWSNVIFSQRVQAYAETSAWFVHVTDCYCSGKKNSKVFSNYEIAFCSKSPPYWWGNFEQLWLCLFDRNTCAIVKTKHQIFSFENICLGKKRRSTVMGKAETFSDWSKPQTLCDMAVIDTNQWVSMEKVWLFNATPLFSVSPLDGTKPLAKRKS